MMHPRLPIFEQFLSEKIYSISTEFNNTPNIFADLLLNILSSHYHGRCFDFAHDNPNGRNYSKIKVVDLKTENRFYIGIGKDIHSIESLKDMDFYIDLNTTPTDRIDIEELIQSIDMKFSGRTEYYAGENTWPIPKGFSY